MMRVLIAGSSGMIGTAVIDELEQSGYEVKRLKRGSDLPPPYWDPDHEKIDLGDFLKPDVIINLCGEPILGRWTLKKRRRILQSRVQTTQFLANFMAGMESPPTLFINASAIGIYGHRDEDPMDEDDVRGNDFLSAVATQWEAATEAASVYGIRTVLLRTGVVLHPFGGALKRMLPFFRLGLGASLGTGQQIMSWISIDDVVGAIRFLIEHTAVEGPVNLTAPHPIRNREFTAELAGVLQRPALFSIPPSILHFFFGDMVDELLLNSMNVIPKKLTEAGYIFQHSDVKSALEDLLKRRNES